jgi:hypothetical protein
MGRRRERYKDIDAAKEKRIKERLRKARDLKSDEELLKENEKAINRFFGKKRK